MPLFYQIPQGLQICVTVAAHDTEAHKNAYKCAYEGGTVVICDKSYNEKRKCWKHMRTVHLKLFNKKCKYADCLWPGCDEEAERLQETWGGAS